MRLSEVENARNGIVTSDQLPITRSNGRPKSSATSASMSVGDVGHVAQPSYHV